MDSLTKRFPGHSNNNHLPKSPPVSPLVQADKRHISGAVMYY